MNKKVIIVGVLLIALVIIAAGVAAALVGTGDSYAARVEAGYRYMEQGDYSNAVLQFRYAIAEDETREDAYIGLYYAYLYSGQEDYARIALNMGISAARSDTLQELLAQLNSSVSGAEISTDTTEPGSAKEVTAVLNTQLLNVFASANYGDYCMQYGSVNGTLTDGRYVRYLDTIGATLVYYDTAEYTVIDTSRSVPYSDCVPNEIYLDNITTLFGGVSTMTYDMLRVLGGVTELSREGNLITFTYSGCVVSITCGEDGRITADCENKLVPANEQQQTTQQSYTVNATVVDATTNTAIAGARVRIYEGYSAYGEAVEGTTNSTGVLSLTLDASGTYTVVVEMDGYISEQYQLIVMSSVYSYDQTFLLAPVMSEDTICFVLTWGSAPSDLDSYLSGTASDGSSVYVYYARKTATSGSGNTIAELDVDDTTAYGPETTTLYDTAGTYEFLVRDFGWTGLLGHSDATVKIYVGASLYTTVNVPVGEYNGTDVWHVCTVSGGQITVINQVRAN